MTNSQAKRIGVLTGGGDCPGLNAVIRAVTKAAIFDYGFEVFGIEDGFLGLIENRIHPLTSDHVSNILTTGGTILGSSNKANPKQFATGRNPDGSPVFSDVTGMCMDHIRSHGLDAIITIGGDGTMSCARTFVELGVNMIGVPKTIDNDLMGTDLTFGHLTAVATATDALDKVHTTAASHHRILIVEVMGRNAGWIALHAGVASGSDIILMPEIPFDIDDVCDVVRERSTHGKRFSIICISEGAAPKGGGQAIHRLDPTSHDPIRLGGISEQLRFEIEDRTGLETRAIILGHVQRGGSPIPSDRILGTEFGYHAIKLFATGEQNRLVVKKGLRTTDTDILDAADQQRVVPMDYPLIAAARAVGTSFGDSE